MFKEISSFEDLPLSIKEELNALALIVPLTFSEKKILCDYSFDFAAWGEKSVVEKLREKFPEILIDEKEAINSEKKSFTILDDKKKDLKKIAKDFFDYIEGEHKKLVKSEKSYCGFEPKIELPRFDKTVAPAARKILGSCPVASEKTRCCNLMTLDAVQGCGFDCSYCSIQSFYKEGKVVFTSNLQEALEKIELDEKKRYHIGSGQSSDSLMWGDCHGLLTNLFEFASKHKNVILEMKSKSSNIADLKKLILQNKVPKNVIFTWSLNSAPVISVEERGTSSLDARINAAREIATLGFAVGFHFHPIVFYKNWEKDYFEVVQKILSTFKKEQIITISLGTLTFIKPVIKKIRRRILPSKILQMPFEQIAGKYSYPYEIKKKIFSTIYNFFPEDWRKNNFFYFCMEDKRIWSDVFGFEYSSNEEFEEAMKEHYFSFIERL